jgi:hypothetical protein
MYKFSIRTMILFHLLVMNQIGCTSHDKVQAGVQSGDDGTYWDYPYDDGFGNFYYGYDDDEGDNEGEGEGNVEGEREGGEHGR